MSYRWRFILLALFLLGFANGLWWIDHKKERWYPGQDSDEYRIVAVNLQEGRGFSREVKEPFLPTHYREPGYSSFIAVIHSLTNRSDDAVAVAQAALLGLSAALTGALGRRIFESNAVAAVAGGLVALSPDLGDHVRYEMSEAVFVPLLLLGMLFTFDAWQKQSNGRGLRAGIVLGLSSFVRIMSAPTALAVIAVSLLLDVRKRPMRWTWAALAVAGLFLVLAPWVFRNSVSIGRTSLTSRSGAYLIPRADKAVAPLERQLQWTGLALWVMTYPVSELVVPVAALHKPPYLWDGPLGNYAHLDSARIFDFYGCEDTPNPTVLQADDCQLETATRLILSHPLQYILMTPVEFARLTFYPYPSKLSLIRSATVWLGLITLVLCLVSRRFRTPNRIWLAAIIGGYTAPSIAGDALDRYGVPLIPFYALFAAAGLVWLARALAPRWLGSATAGLVGPVREIVGRGPFGRARTPSA